MDDQTNNPTTTPNVLGSAPTMGGDVTAPSTEAPVTDSVPSIASPAMPTYEPVPAVEPESTAPVAQTDSDDSVQAALKRIEDKLNTIALKVGA
ncbi:hypothetical protein M1349_01060 [Patescibacteria group bacterium]|nr:hypothetical protein [Patescibacteria group bacterium]